MTRRGYFSKFQWRDRLGKIWTVQFDRSPIGFTARVTSGIKLRAGVIHVRTHSIGDPEPSIARLNDIQVDAPFENRGMGSMLVREALEICKRLGQEGMDGDLSIVDSDHFDKLRHFYEKLGFSVVFYSPGDPDYRISRVGKIEMLFNNVREEP